MKRSLLCLLFFATISVALTQNLTYKEKLFYSCKVWGFVKYYHSEVSTCQVNWDSVLLSTFPMIKSAVSNNDYNEALASMLNAAGPMALAATPPPDTLPPELKRNLNFGWINDPVFRDDVKVILDTIKNNFRPHPICWVNDGNNNTGWLAFPYDDPMIHIFAYTNYPTESNRLLLLFKYWNVIRYFNPYNYVQDVPWDSTFSHNVLSLASATDYTAFFKTIKKIAAGCNDAHVEGLTSSSMYNMYGNYCPKIILRYSQSNYIVVKSGYSAISKGDILVSVDGKSTTQWEDSLRPYISAGNPSVFRRFMCKNLLSGAQNSQLQIGIKDSLGNDHSLTAKRYYNIYDNWFYNYYPNDTLGNVKWKKWSCNAGYVNMDNLESNEVASMYDALKNTTSIIFDIRNYPYSTAWDIAEYLYPDRMCFSKLTEPSIVYPGTCSWYYDSLGHNGNPDSYSGKVIILCNQESLSMAEYSCMILGAMPNSVIVGSQTAGTDGNVSAFQLSLDIQTGFTSLGVYYPNGDSTERIGIVPDSLVYITPEGVRQGRDEVLEKALQVAGCLVPMLSVTPEIQYVALTAGTVTFTLTSNTNWSAVSDAAWCTVTSSGSGNGKITANFGENTSVIARTATITVTAIGVSAVTITVLQAAVLPVLSVTPSNQDVPATPAGSTTFSVASNTSWNVSSDQGWCSVSPPGIGNGTIEAGYTENDTYQPRIAQIHVSVAGLPEQIITITQAKSTIGIEERRESAYRVFPNPTKGLFRFIPPETEKGTLDVHVQDLNGLIILQGQFKGEKEYEIDLSSAARGIYFITIKTVNSLTVQKLIIE
ncbi:MAG: BACON domain-containing carbohydrate-binding protein [Bacteroidales bacterium]|nr:BACON domain-containing carbohydrate-binding protein [Bacteroidales bacterium]